MQIFVIFVVVTVATNLNFDIYYFCYQTNEERIFSHKVIYVWIYKKRCLFQSVFTIVSYFPMNNFLWFENAQYFYLIIIFYVTETAANMCYLSPKNALKGNFSICRFCLASLFFKGYQYTKREEIED